MAEIDFERLRAERRRRLLAAMDGAGLDALVLGREANARYAAGARRLWTSGTRPFGPGCVVVRATGAVHLLSTWDDGIPPEVPHSDLFGLSWNPVTMLTTLAGRPGVAQARRVGVDGMSPLFAQLLPMVLPGSDLVDASGLLRSVRAAKLPEEIACIRTAVAVAESALGAALARLAPGIRPRDLTAAAAERLCQLGVTTPGREATFVPSDGSVDRPVAPGDLLACQVSALYAGYEGVVERTRSVDDPDEGDRARHRRWAARWPTLLAACRPGQPAAALLDAYRANGEPLPHAPIAYGLGLGMEPPIVGAGSPPEDAAATILAPGMVLAVGDTFAREVVLITEGDPEVLTRQGHGPQPG